jgi:hypothetical protein
MAKTVFHQQRIATEADCSVQIFSGGECVGLHVLVDLVKPISSGLILEMESLA